MKLTDFNTAADAYRYFSRERLWQLFDGNRDALNIAHECVDRHLNAGVAIDVVRPDAERRAITFRELSQSSAQFAHWLNEIGVERGDRVAVMLEPSLAFYSAIFGAMKAGAVAVPLFTLFGPDGLRLRVDDCKPRVLLAEDATIDVARQVAADAAYVADDSFMANLGEFPPSFPARTRAEELALLQYTSGTTREFPQAVPHSHRAVVTVAMAALYGLGIRPGDRYFCPSSPAWGHGMWHGTISPLALGVRTGAYAGSFNASTLLRAISELKVTNLAAASTHYRMMREVPHVQDMDFCIKKLSFTGEPMDDTTADFVQTLFDTPACSMYGTTETGVILVNFPGASDFKVKKGSLGRPMPGMNLAVVDANGEPCEVRVTGEIMLRRRDAWFATKDLGYIDEDGYFYHAGRADDVIISAGWTMSAAEIESVLMKHEAVRECAVIGVADARRGHVVKAFVVTYGAISDDQPTLVASLQNFTRERLSRHEYPRQVAFVDALPKTPAGKINRRALREREAQNQKESKAE